MVKLLRADLPETVDMLCCKMKADGTEVTLAVTDTSKLTKRPALNFRFRKASTHVTLTFIAKSGTREMGSCVYPLTFNNRLIRLFKPLLPSDLSQRTHLVHLSAAIAELEAKRLVGKIWFQIIAKNPSINKKLKESSTHLDQSGSTSDVAKLPISKDAELVSRESGALCIPLVPSKTATVSVLFHSVTTLRPKLTSDDILPIACIGSSPEIREDALFNGGEGSTRTLPTLRPITLRCGGDDDGKVLELHVTETDTTSSSPTFSATCPLTDLVFFQHYNWEYNWRWQPGVSGFSPEHSRGNLEENLTVSIVHWPPLSDYLDYEGLEVFVKGVEFDCRHEKADLVLCCRLIGVDDKKTSVLGIPSVPPYRGQQSEGEDEKMENNFNTTVIRCHSNKDDQPNERSGYFFFSVDPNFVSKSDHLLEFILYATSHNADLWWHTASTSTASIDLSEALREVLLQPDNHKGARWELTGNVITDSPEGALTTGKIHGMMRWKERTKEFLSCDAIAQNSELPWLSDLSVSELMASPLDDKSLILYSQLFPVISLSDKEAQPDIMWKEIVSKLGADILKLRKENKTLKEKNSEFERYIVEMETSIVATAADQKSLLPLTKTDLIHKIVELSNRFSVETQTRKTFQNRVHALQNSLIEKNDVESSYNELKEAHKAQQNLVQELQGKITKYKKCADTCKQQETVINRLESLLAKGSRDHKSKDAQTLDALSKENTKLRGLLRKYQDSDTGGGGVMMERDTETVETLRNELSIAKRRLHELEEVAYLSEHNGVHSMRGKLESLERKLEVAITREGAVLEELKECASKWAREKARYELQMAQLRQNNASFQSGGGKKVQAQAESRNTRTSRTQDTTDRASPLDSAGTRDHTAASSRTGTSNHTATRT